MSSIFVVGPSVPWLLSSKLIAWAQKSYMSVKLYYPSGETLTASANKAINVLYTLLTAHYDNIVSAPHRLDGLHRDKAARRYWRCGLRCCIFSFTQYIKQKLGAQIIQQVSWFPGWNGELIKKRGVCCILFQVEWKKSSVYVWTLKDFMRKNNYTLSDRIDSLPLSETNIFAFQFRLSKWSVCVPLTLSVP